MAQATPVEVPLNEADGFMPDVKEMQRQVTSPTRMVIVNTPCDPTVQFAIDLASKRWPGLPRSMICWL
jgi:aspartate/methionine/tyrosine aminotransferase